MPSYLRSRYVGIQRFEYPVPIRASGTPKAPWKGSWCFRVEQVRDRARPVLRVVEFLASPGGEATFVRAG
jgi:hypothetical protein